MIINLDTSLLPMVLIGLFGSTHCLGMCGGIAAAIGVRQPHQRLPHRLQRSLLYNLGRILSYTLIGAAAGGLGLLLGELLALPYWNKLLRSLTGLLLIGIGLQMAIAWRGLNWLQTAGARLWQRIAPLAKHFIPLETHNDALLLGLLWGWLPCGLVYSVLATATTSGSAVNGALYMASFGLGTLPAMLGVGMFSLQLQQLLQNKKLKLCSALLVIAFGLWTIASVWISAQPHHAH